MTTVRVTPGVDRKSCLNAFFNQDRLNRLKFLPVGCLTDIIDKIINATPNDDNSTTAVLLEMDQCDSYFGLKILADSSLK